MDIPQKLKGPPLPSYGGPYGLPIQGTPELGIASAFRDLYHPQEIQLRSVN